MATVLLCLGASMGGVMSWRYLSSFTNKLVPMALRPKIKWVHRNVRMRMTRVVSVVDQEAMRWIR